MFDGLANYRNVLVTGPHRSGTTIASEIIASRFWYTAVRECEIARPRFEGDDCPYLDAEMVKRYFAENSGVVLQGATCFRWIKELQSPDLATVYIARNHDEVIASQKRYRGKQIDSPSEKRDQWDSLVESGLITFPLLIEYESLAELPGFHKNRDGWEPRQTQP